MAPQNPEVLAGRLATIEAEQKATAASCKEMATEQKKQGLALATILANSETNNRDQEQQTRRFDSHSGRLRDLEASAAKVEDLPEEVATLKEIMGKRGFMAAVFTGVATLAVVAFKFFSSGGKTP